MGHNMLFILRLQTKKRAWLRLVITIVIGSLSLSACGSQKTPQVYRVGILNGASIFSEISEGFKLKMSELGYIEGQNIIYDIQKSNGNKALEQKALKQFVTDKIDLLFVFPTGPFVAAKSAAQGTEIPIMFAMTFIEETGLIKSV